MVTRSDWKSNDERCCANHMYARPPLLGNEVCGEIAGGPSSNHRRGVRICRRQRIAEPLPLRDEGRPELHG